MQEHDFANAILLGEYPNQIESDCRDFIFEHALSKFDGKPVSIFQVGGIETFDVRWRVGSGWSDILFGEYVKKHGGLVTVVDISLDNIAKSYLASQRLGYNLIEIYGDAIDHIGPGYDIYYLDGGNDPQETFDQYMKIKDESAIVLVDDFNIKGTILKSYLTENGIYYNHYNVANEVILINNLKRD